MNFLINLIAIPLGFLMKIIYNLVGNYGISIILFTFVTRMILFPVSYKQQKNTARMQLLNPKLKKLQEKYKNDPNKMQMEQFQLYQDENINPYSSCLTSFIPLILLWGVLAVVYKPMTYILDYDTNTIEEAKSIVISLDESAEKNLTKNSMRQELIIMEKMLQNPEAFSAVIRDGEITFVENETETAQKLNYIDQNFVTEVTDFAKTFTLGSVKLSETPSTKPSENSSFFLFLIPILSGLMQLVFTIYTQKMQKKRNPDMPNMGSMNAMLYMMPLFSVWLAFTVPAGVGFYWLCSSVFSFLQSMFLYAWFNEERVEKIGEIEREKAKKAKKRPSMMQKLMEQQEEMMRQQDQEGISGNRVRYSDSDGTTKISRSEMEEYNTSVIREARRRIAEKYGDLEPEADSGTGNKNKKKK
ncbi:MAG: YidC/Oxa1 family membrane protein insertase [Oscillospiraceae bacterium]|nr:YidC/Oxa1 family membrane protein insertase [Oscillospiraceae bacterium]